MINDNNRGDEPELSLGFVLAAAAARAEDQWSSQVRDIGLKPIHVGVLQIIAGGPVQQSRLSERLDAFKPAMVAVINEMTAMGLLERRPHPRDRRAVEIHLLAPGQAKLREATTINKRSTREFFGALSFTEQTSLHDMLARLASDPSSQRRGREEAADHASE